MQFRFADATIRVTHPDTRSVMDAVAARLSAGLGFALATINLDHLVKLAHDPAFRRAYAAQDFVVADGNPIIWLSWLARQPVRLVPGSDLVLPLVRAAVKAGRPVSVLGSNERSLQAAALQFERLVPGMRRGVLIAPPMGLDPEGPDVHAMLSQVQKMGPGLCLLAFGAPKQERIAALGRKLAPEVGFVSVGAGVDFIAGTQRRAPGWVRALAMEWLWRALSAPRKMVPRYIACAVILPGEAAKAVLQRRDDS